MIPILLSLAVTAPGTFADHGVGAPVAERRTLNVMADSHGTPFALATAEDQSPRPYLLVTNLTTGETRQIELPEQVTKGAVFCSFESRNGRWYSFYGKWLVEFDLDQGAFTFVGVPAESEAHVTGIAMADGPDGRIYAGTYPNCHLVAFDPATQEMTDFGQLDPAEHYTSFLAFDEDGWAYAGIGTARANIVGYHPATRELRPLLAEADRVAGTASVVLGVDGVVYGVANKQTWRLRAGVAEPVEKAAARALTGVAGYGHMTQTGLPDGSKVSRYDTDARVIQITAADKTTREFPLEYQSEGADLTSLSAGPDGCIYASSAHPMHLVRYDPVADAIADLGAVPKVGGGNFCSMATLGNYLIASSYASGDFYRFDPTLPFNGGTGDEPNPRMLATFPKDIARPRTTVAYPDGRHGIMAGYMGYGLTGGGLAIVDVETGEATLLTHEQVIPNQSTTALRVLPDGNLVGLTSVDTPGGGHEKAPEAMVYLFDWATRQVTFSTVAAPGARMGVALGVFGDGQVLGIMSTGATFVFDPATRTIVHRESTAQYGGIGRDGLVPAPDGGLYGLFGRAVVKFDAGTFAHRALGTPPLPIRAGGALVGGRLYYVTPSRVGSFQLPLEELPGGK